MNAVSHFARGESRRPPASTLPVALLFHPGMPSAWFPSLSNGAIFSVYSSAK